MARLAALFASLAVLLAVVPAAAPAATTTAASQSSPALRAHFALAHPSAGRLCESVAAGRIPPGLAASTAQLDAACADLKSGYAAARAALDAATAPLRDQLSAAREQAAADCAAGDRAACRAALRTFRTTSRAIAKQGRAALAQYRIAVRAADSAFFGAVRSLGPTA